MAFDAGVILAKMSVDISQWQKSAAEINASQKRIAGQTKKTGTAFKGMWKQVAVGIGVTTLISKGIRGITRQMSDTVKVGREFEKEWANVTTMLDVSRIETAKMRKELRMLSPTLGDTTDLAKGMYQVLSASVKPAKAIRFLGEAAISAKAGVTDTRTAVDALTTVINAYGMEAEDVTDVSDIMFATVKKGKLTYGELAQSLGTVVPIAATVGVEFKEIAAATSTLTRQGIDASKATMQLRQVLMAVLKPGADAAALAEDLEIKMGAQAIATKGLSGWLLDLKEKTGGSADLMARLVPKARALTAVMALAGEQTEAYTDDLGYMDEALGLTDIAFKKQMETADFWVETFGTAMDKIKIAIYDGLTSQLREAISTSEDFDKIITQTTNDAANAVSLHISIMIEELTKLGKAFKKADEFLFGWADRLHKGKKGTDELAEATIKLKEALGRAGIATNIEAEAIDEVGEAAVRTRTKIEMLIPPIQAVKFETMALSDVVANESTLAWEQFEIAAEDTFASVMEGMGFFVRETEENIAKTGTQVKSSLADVATSAGHLLMSLGQHSKALAYSGAVINVAMGVTQALRAYPPPISFAMAALQAAAGAVQIGTISKQTIPSAAEGAYLPSPAIIEAGHGARGEVVLPLDRAPGSAGGAKVDFNFYAPIISTTGLSGSDMDRVAEEFFRKMEREARRRGFEING